MSTSPREIDHLFQSQLYLHFHEDSLDDKRTDQEGAFIEQCCQLRSGQKILDLACGHGRHSHYFAEKNYGVTGVDINQAFLEIAGKVAGERDYK